MTLIILGHFGRCQGIGEVSLERLLAVGVFTFRFFLLVVLAGEGCQFVHAEFNYKSYFGQNHTIRFHKG